MFKLKAQVINLKNLASSIQTIDDAESKMPAPNLEKTKDPVFNYRTTRPYFMNDWQKLEHDFKEIDKRQKNIIETINNVSILIDDMDMRDIEISSLDLGFFLSSNIFTNPLLLINNQEFLLNKSSVGQSKVDYSNKRLQPYLDQQTLF